MGFGKQGTGIILRENVANAALGALASVDLVGITAAIVLQEDFRILKSEIICIISGLTAGEGEGLVFGMANGELSAAEIEECLEAIGPLDRNDRVAHERAMRKVDTLGVLKQPSASSTEGSFENAQGGRIMTSTKRWTYSDPEGYTYWIYNLGPALTTGATAQLLATHYGVWVT